MNTPARVAAVALTTALIAAVPATSDAASGRHWSDLKPRFGGTERVCKTSVNGGKQWRVSAQLDNRKGHQTLTSGLIVEKTVSGEQVEQRRFTTKPTKKHTLSDVGSVLYPQSAKGFQLVAFTSESQAGDGGPIHIAKINVC